MSRMCNKETEKMKICNSCNINELKENQIVCDNCHETECLPEDFD